MLCTGSSARMLALLCLLPLVFGTASAGDDEVRTEIGQRLRDWAHAFNRRDVAGVCDLFADDLVSMVPDAPDAGRDAVCARLADVLARPDLKLAYEPDIREILVSGDLAVVRLYWTLTTEREGVRSVGREAGLDVFRRQPDGRWSIIRFMAFTAEHR